MPDWRPGGELTASELSLEAAYEEQRIRRHLRLVHGWGVVCGLNVVSAGKGWDLYICPGYGISPCGDEIVVPARYGFNLRDYLWTQPLGEFMGNVAWIGIEAGGSSHAEAAANCSGSGDCTSETPAGDDAALRVVVSWARRSGFERPFDICSGMTPTCPPCPPACELLLAAVTLPAANRDILNSLIQNIHAGGD